MTFKNSLYELDVPDSLIYLAYRKEISLALTNTPNIDEIMRQIKEKDPHYKTKTISYVSLAGLAAIASLGSVLTTAPSLSFWFSAAGIEDEVLALSLAHGVALLSAGMMFYVSLRTTRLVKGWIDRGLLNIPDEEELNFSKNIPKTELQEKEGRKIAFLIGLLICTGAGAALGFLAYETMRLFYNENLPNFIENTENDTNLPHINEAIIFIAVALGLISSIRMLSHWAGMLRSHKSFTQNANNINPLPLSYRLGIDSETCCEQVDKKENFPLLAFGLGATVLCFGALARSLQQGTDLAQEDEGLKWIAFGLLAIAHVPMLSRGLGFLLGCLQGKKDFSLGNTWNTKTLWSLSMLAQIFISASVAMIGVCVLFETAADREISFSDEEASILPVDETSPLSGATESPAFNRFQFYTEPKKLALQTFAGMTAAITTTGNRLRSCEVPKTAAGNPLKG